MNVLVADNSKVVRTIIREELESINLNVYEADGRESIYRILSTDSIDLMTIAVQLHDGNGFDICSEVTSEEFAQSSRNYSGHRFPIIFITGNDNLNDRKRGFESGAADFISKPFSRGEVANSVKKILFPETSLKGATAIVADDSNQSRMIVCDFLISHGVIVFEATDGLEGYELIREYGDSIDLIITDYEMPRMTGDELCFRVRKELNLRDIPILVLSGAGSRVSVLDLFRSGATDYLHKPFIKEELLGRLYVHLESRLLRKKLVQKIRHTENLNIALKRMATVDALTRIPNRRFFFERFKEAIHRRDRFEHSVSLLIIDIDNFKSINNTFGHQAGDWILQEMARVLNHSIRKVDLLGRLGGDEFGIVTTHIDKAGIHSLGLKLAKRISNRQFLANRSMDPGRITICLGAYISNPGDHYSAEELHRLADECLQVAKRNGKNRIFCRSSIERKRINESK